MGVIMDAALDGLEDYEFEKTASFSDGDGVVGVEVERGSETFVMVAKKYSYKNLASFMKEAALEAASADCWLIFYDHDTGRYTVFDSQYVTENANPSEGPSKKSHAEWLELSRTHGTELTPFLDDRDYPDRLADDQNSATLDQFT